MTDKVLIEGLQILAFIGVYEWERQAPQKLLLDIEMSVDLRAAAASDDLQHTVDYAQIATDMAQIAESHQPKLLESLAGKMCDHILQHPLIANVTLKVSKPAILPQAQNVAIQLFRARTQRQTHSKVFPE